MYGAATNHLKERVANILRGTSAAGYSNLYVGLLHNDPTETGTAGVELNYTGYDRQPVTFTPPALSPGGVAIQNVAELLWLPPPTATQSVLFAGVYDAQNGGNMLWRVQLSVPLEIIAGMPPSLDTGDLILELTGHGSVWFKTQVLSMFRGQNVSGISPFASLHSGDPEAGGIELSGGGYERQPVTLSTPASQVGGHMQMSNETSIRFPRPTSPQGNLAYIGIHNAQSGGNLVYKIEWIPNIFIQRNYTPRFLAGRLRVNVD
ncbi:MAG: hypothetical protein FWE19_00590 [Oscillospiraceae bacterium]|nr:hypothetical protein [Oscillospiraceae bacterium]